MAKIFRFSGYFVENDKTEDVANLAVYLLSDAANWMTGASLDLSGGGEGLLTM